MKKLIMVVTVVLILVLTLYACGQSEPASTSKTTANVGNPLNGRCQTYCGPPDPVAYMAMQWWCDEVSSDPVDGLKSRDSECLSFVLLRMKSEGIKIRAIRSMFLDFQCCPFKTPISNMQFLPCLMPLDRVVTMILSRNLSISSWIGHRQPRACRRICKMG